MGVTEKEEQDMKIEIHICPILMRTVKFVDGRCTEFCNEEDCPVMVELLRQEENK